MVDGKWPWESGEMPVAKPRPDDPERDEMLYTLPRILDPRHPEADANGYRVARPHEHAKARGQHKDPDTSGSPFDW